MLILGQQAVIEVIVSESDTAASLKSGLLPVLATPRLVAWCEEAACQAIEGQLLLNQTTVGIKVDIDHIAPTPVGMRVSIISKLIEIDDWRLKFELSVSDEAGQIAHGYHERFIVDADKFVLKANHKY